MKKIDTQSYVDAICPNGTPQMLCFPKMPKRVSQFAKSRLSESVNIY